MRNEGRKKQRDAGVIKIRDLFGVYKKRLRPPQGVVIKETQELLEDMFNTSLTKEKISYTVGTRTLHIQTHGPLKSEIMLKKEEILAHLIGRLGEQHAPKEIV